MKKPYIIPESRVIYVDVDELIASSPTPVIVGGDDDNATSQDDEDPEGIFGGGDGLARRDDLWGNTW